MKNGVRKLFFHESLQLVLVGCVTKPGTAFCSPGKGLPLMTRQKVQASKPHNHITALQGFDQVMSVTIPLASKDKPKVKGLQVKRKEKIFLKNNPIYPKKHLSFETVCSVFIW